MVFFLLIIGAIIYSCLPWYISLILWFINLFIPDPIPVVDEVVMLAVTIRKFIKFVELYDFLERYWKVVLLIIVGIIIAFIAFLVGG